MDQSSEGPRPERRRDQFGRFSGARTNVEDMPRLPTFAARWTVEDRRGRPYIVFWEGRGFFGAHALRMETTGRRDAVRVVGETGGTIELPLEWRALPKRWPPGRVKIRPKTAQIHYQSPRPPRSALRN